MDKPYIVAQERLLLTRDGRVVGADHADGVRLFASVGQRIPIDTARQFGIESGTATESLGAKVKRLWLGPPSDKAYHGKD